MSEEKKITASYSFDGFDGPGVPGSPTKLEELFPARCMLGRIQEQKDRALYTTFLYGHLIRKLGATILASGSEKRF